jgi:hypothetical protein
LAVLELFEFVQADMFPRMVVSLIHGMLKETSTSLSTKMKRTPRYHGIWPLSILLRFMQDDTTAEKLGGNELMARTAALFMIFSPCRPVAMIRMDCARARWAEPERVLVVPAKEKMDKGRGYTELVLKKMDNELLCPLRHYPWLQRRVRRLGVDGSLFCSEDGKPYAQSAQLSMLLKQLLGRAGIDRKYPAYSIRHALITALFDAGLSESQVNAYTGHSNNAHTAATSYFYLNSKWIGHAIASSVLSPAVFASTDPVVARDNAEGEVEEMEEYGESESDILGAPRQASSIPHLPSSSSPSSSSSSFFSSLHFSPHAGL